MRSVLRGYSVRSTDTIVLVLLFSFILLLFARMCSGISLYLLFAVFVGKHVPCLGLPILCFCTIQAKTYFLYWAKSEANTQGTEQSVLSAFGNLLQTDSVLVFLSKIKSVDFRLFSFFGFFGIEQCR